MCGTHARRDICWKFTFKFKESLNGINYKIDFAGDFGRGIIKCIKYFFSL